MKRWLRIPMVRDLLPILILGLIAELLVNPLGNFPSNDDWVYALAVKEILHSGVYGAPAPSLPDLVLQAYWGALFCLPFGFSFVALRISTLVLGAVGLIGAYGFCREAGGSRRIAIMATLTLALNPFYFQLSNTFMTDVPYIALNAIALWSFARGMREGRDRWVNVAIGVALATIFVRQFAIILVFAFGLARAARTGWSRRSLLDLSWTTALGIIGHLLFYYWLLASGRTPPSAMPMTAPPITLALLPYGLIHSLILLQYLGLMLSPIYMATAFGTPLAILRRKTPFFVFLFIAVVAGELWLVARTDLSLPNYGNVLLPFGVGPVTLRDIFLLGANVPVTPLPLAIVWRVARVIGVLVAGMIAVDLADLIRRAFLGATGRLGEAWLAIVLTTITLAYGAAWLVMATFHGALDRYALMMLLPIAATVATGEHAQHRSRLGWAGAAIVLSGFALFSVAAVHDYLAFQRARLAATDGLESAGVTAHDIDGGYEYNGLRLHDAAYRRRAGKSYWWVDDDRYIIALGPLPGYVVQQRYGFVRWLTGSQAEVVVLRRLADPTK